MNIKEIYDSSKSRTITALIILLAVSVIFIIDNNFLTWSFFGIAYMIAFFETMSLIDIDNKSYFAYALAIWLAALIYPAPEDLSFIVVIIAVSIMVHKKNLDYKSLFPFIYPTIPILFLYSLYKDFGVYSMIWLISIVAGSDIGAYVVGKAIGKTPFSKTSPNKTWEGTIGGILIASLLGTIIGVGSVHITIAIVVSVLASLASVWGDLFESYLKREAGVKDSGNIFPGHGGMLDRVDGYMFASIIMLVLLRGLL